MADHHITTTAVGTMCVPQLPVLSSVVDTSSNCRIDRDNGAHLDYTRIPPAVSLLSNPPPPFPTPFSFPPMPLQEEEDDDLCVIDAVDDISLLVNMYKGERNDLLTDSITRTLTKYSVEGVQVLISAVTLFTDNITYIKQSAVPKVGYRTLYLIADPNK